MNLLRGSHGNREISEFFYEQLAAVRWVRIPGTTVVFSSRRRSREVTRTKRKEGERRRKEENDKTGVKKVGMNFQ